MDTPVVCHLVGILAPLCRRAGGHLSSRARATKHMTGAVALRRGGASSRRGTPFLVQRAAPWGGNVCALKGAGVAVAVGRWRGLQVEVAAGGPDSILRATLSARGVDCGAADSRPRGHREGGDTRCAVGIAAMVRTRSGGVAFWLEMGRGCTVCGTRFEEGGFRLGPAHLPCRWMAHRWHPPADPPKSICPHLGERTAAFLVGVASICPTYLWHSRRSRRARSKRMLACLFRRVALGVFNLSSKEDFHLHVTRQ